MKYKIDVKRLRNDLKDYFGTAIMNVSPLAVMNLSKVENASDREIIEIAQKYRIDLKKYFE